MTNHLFVYGTLMFPRVMHSVTGKNYVGCPATLEGFARYLVKDQLYPGIVPQSKAQTSGILYKTVDLPTLTKLDQFEGTFYKRQNVSVHLSDGTVTQAQTYVVCPQHRQALSPQPWQPETFLAHHLEKFLTTYRPVE